MLLTCAYQSALKALLTKNYCKSRESVIVILPKNKIGALYKLQYDIRNNMHFSSCNPQFCRRFIT